MRKLAVLSFVVISALSGSSVAMAGGRYVVAEGTDGGNDCYNVDSDGTPYGLPVAASFCAASYGVATDMNGGNNCFAMDRDGTPFGYPVDAGYCQARR